MFEKGKRNIYILLLPKAPTEQAAKLQKKQQHIGRLRKENRNAKSTRHHKHLNVFSEANTE